MPVYKSSVPKHKFPPRERWITLTDDSDPRPSQEVLDNLPERQTTVTFLTWAMIWDRSDQTSWWVSTSSEGATVEYDGTWGAVDWLDKNKALSYLIDIRQSGMHVVIWDMTNGWDWLDNMIYWYQDRCNELGLTSACAVKGKADSAGAASRAQDVYDRFYDRIPTGGTTTNYFVTDQGKPLLIIYDGVKGYKTVMGTYQASLDLFDVRWASGENSNKGKFGWQLEPWIGPVSSTGAMLITPSVRWSGATYSATTNWTKSIAFLEYGFLLAQEANPKYIIVSSYDDLFERNSWLVADTSGSIVTRHVHDYDGTLSTDTLHTRVVNFALYGARDGGVPGGIFDSGPYRLFSVGLQMYATIVSTSGAINGLAKLEAESDDFRHIWWLWHQGSSKYRICNLSTGLFLDWNGSGLKLVLPSTDATQIWTCHYGPTDGTYLFVNCDNGQFLRSVGSIGIMGGTGISTSNQFLWKVTAREEGYMPSFTPVFDDME